MRRYTKIKYDEKKGKVYLAFSCGQNYENNYTVECTEKPAPEFIEAMKALNEIVVQMCELPESYQKRIATKSVSLSYGGESEVMSATISAQMELYESNTPLNLNTPNKPAEPYSEAQEYDEVTCLSRKCIERLEILMEEADRYVDGHRAQGTLWGPDAA